MMTTGFVAYPSNPPEIGDTIRPALESINGFTGWEDNDIAGRFIVGPILTEIKNSDVVVADVTRLNFNVAYEIGYAIGKRKRTFLIRNSSINGDEALAREVGVFDTLGYNQYANHRQLGPMLSGISDFKPLESPDDEPDQLPVYVVLPKLKAESDVQLISKLKKSRLQFRSFDAEEHGRLAGTTALRNVAISHGVIAPLLPNNRTESKVHNLRAAFVGGIAAGMDKEVLLVQYNDDDPVPIDYRDLVRLGSSEGQIDHAIAEFAPLVIERMQVRRPLPIPMPATFLARLHLGASLAENEMSALPGYYLETEEYRRVARGESQIVTGRKGSGKTALFVQVRDNLRRNRQTVILDLRPEGSSLSNSRT